MDVLAEGIHFRLDWTSFRDLGYKAAAVNLSDLAAMGAEAEGLLGRLGAPAGCRGRAGGRALRGSERGGRAGPRGRHDARSVLVPLRDRLWHERARAGPCRRSPRRRARRHRPIGRLGRRPPRPRARPPGFRPSLRRRIAGPRFDSRRVGRWPASRIALVDLSDGIGSDAARMAEPIGLQGRPRSRGDSTRTADRRSRRPRFLGARRGLRAFGCARLRRMPTRAVSTRRRPHRGRLRRRARLARLGLVPGLGSFAEPAFPGRLVVALGARTDHDLLRLPALEEDDRGDREQRCSGTASAGSRPRSSSGT